MDYTKRIFANLASENDKHIKVKLEQDVREIEILSLRLSQENNYGTFNSDFGVIVGRVIANGGIGVPNAKLSIFIPIDENDKNNEDIYAIYPYETPRDLNGDGKRYNLLPRTSKLNFEGTYKPKQPFGSFPNKEEILTNTTYLDIYKKYYKYTTITNDSGDYMLFGVPVGVQTVHMSVDITDIGEYSMSPIEMIQNLGYSQYLFSDDGISIKPQKLLSDLPHIETQEISVNVIPYWGDSNNFDIGITRQDFKIRAELISSIIVFGTIGTMGEPCVIGTPSRADRKNKSFYYLSNNVEQNIDIRTLRGSDSLKFRVFSFNSNINKDDIDYDLAYTGTTISEYREDRKINPAKDMYELDQSEFYSYVSNGSFVLVIPCNRDKVITDEFGNKIPSPNSSVGVYSKFIGCIVAEYENNVTTTITQDHGGNTYYGGDGANNTRGIIKIPQHQHSLQIYYKQEDKITDSDDSTTIANYLESEKWRKSYYEFEYGNYYSISQFFPTFDWDSGYLTNNLSNNDRIRDYTLHGFLFKTSGIDYLDDYKFKYDIYNQENEYNAVRSYDFGNSDIFPSGNITISATTTYNDITLYGTTANTMLFVEDNIIIDDNIYDQKLNLNGRGNTSGIYYKVIGINLKAGTYDVNVLCSATTSTMLNIFDTNISVGTTPNIVIKEIILTVDTECLIYTTGSTNISIYSIWFENKSDTIKNTFIYDFPYNKVYNREGYTETYFGAQWLNMMLVLPQFSYTKDYQHEYRKYQVASLLFNEREKDSFFLEYNTTNNQLMMGSAYRTVNLLRASSFRTAFIKIPKSLLISMDSINRKGLNGGDVNGDPDNVFMYQTPNNSSTTTDYSSAYDEINKGPYIFKGFYNNDCIKLLYDLNIL